MERMPGGGKDRQSKLGNAVRAAALAGMELLGTSSTANPTTVESPNIIAQVQTPAAKLEKAEALKKSFSEHLEKIGKDAAEARALAAGDLTLQATAELRGRLTNISRAIEIELPASDITAKSGMADVAEGMDTVLDILESYQEGAMTRGKETVAGAVNRILGKLEAATKQAREMLSLQTPA